MNFKIIERLVSLFSEFVGFYTYDLMREKLLNVDLSGIFAYSMENVCSPATILWFLLLATGYPSQPVMSQIGPSKNLFILKRFG